MTTPLPPIDPPATDGKLPGEIEVAALYRQLPQSEPGPALDAAVLHAAARALEGAPDQPQAERRKRPREPGDWGHSKPFSAIVARAIPSVEAAATARRRRVPHWLIGLGSAASLVLVAGLAWHMRDMPRPGPETAAAADGIGATQESAAPSPDDPGAGRPDAGRPGASKAQRFALASAPPTPVGASMQTERRANRLPPAALPGLKASAPGASATATAPFTLSDKPIAQDDAAVINATRRSVREKRAASAPNRPASAVNSKAAAAPAVMEAAPNTPPASPPSEDGPTAANPSDTPNQELAKIELLVQQHHEAEARRRLQAFRRAHPQSELPANLRGVLGEP